MTAAPVSAVFSFTVSPETMEAVKANRLKFFEQQIAESQMNIRIYEANVTAYGLAQDSVALTNEIAKLDRLTLSYNVVKDLD